MATTTMIVEILVIGYTAYIWLFLLGSSFFRATPGDLINDWIATYKGWATLVLLLSAAVAYQIGSLLDYFSYLLFYHGIRISGKNKDKEKRCLDIGRKIKRQVIRDGWFWNVYNLVNQEASDGILNELKMDHSMIRLMRAGFVNFALIGISLFSLELPIVYRLALSIVFVGISISCIFAMKLRWRHWYAKMAESYCYLKMKKGEEWKSALEENPDIWENKTPKTTLVTQMLL